MSEEMGLKIIVKYDEVGGCDGLDVKLIASPNIALGFIQRARFELDKMEKQVMANLSKNPDGGNLWK